MNWVEPVATVAGILCVLLLVRESVWNFPFGIIQVALSIYVFYEQRLYSDLVLHVIYVILNVYGWIHWSRGTKRHELPVTRLTGRAIAGWLVVTVILTAAWGTLMKVKFAAAAPYVDASILMASGVAQWLTARKKLESWWFWILVDLIAIPLYASRGLYFFTGLYVVFLLLCILGIHEWRRSIPAAPAAASV
jgi:nicotinamide mononucleotide transporter